MRPEADHGAGERCHKQGSRHKLDEDKILEKMIPQDQAIAASSHPPDTPQSTLAR